MRTIIKPDAPVKLHGGDTLAGYQISGERYAKHIGYEELMRILVGLMDEKLAFIQQNPNAKIIIDMEII